MEIKISGYPETFTFETTMALPEFEYGCEVRHREMVKAMEQQKIDSPSHGYDEYVVESIQKTKQGGETWHLGS